MASQECTATMRYARNAAQTVSKKTVIRAASGNTSATNAACKYQEGAKHRFTDEQIAQAVKTCAEGMSLSATAHVIGASIPTVNEWVKKRGIGDRASDTVFIVADKRAAG